jgi:hypothetical protein
MIYLTFSVITLIFIGVVRLSSRLLSLHLLAIWIFFSALPTLSSQIANDVDLSEALVWHAYLPILYLVGVMIASVVMADSEISESLGAKLQKIRSDRRGHFNLMLLFIVVFSIDFLLRLSYDILGSGTQIEDVVAGLPYLVTSTLFITSDLLFGLFCYACLTIRLSSLAKFLAALFMIFILVSEGRRSFILALFALPFLANADFRLRFNWREISLVTIAPILFVVITPIFLEFRSNLQELQLAGGDSAISSFPSAISKTINSGYAAIPDASGSVSENFEKRGNAGVFFYRVAEAIPSYQGGTLLENSFRWIVPSFISTKPEAYTETLIQVVSRLPVVDDAISIPTIFLADFGPIGVLIAGFLTAAFLYTISRYLAREGSFGLVQVFLLGSFFSYSFRVEAELAEAFEFFRNLLIVAALGWVWRLAFKEQPTMLTGRAKNQRPSRLS